MKTYFQPYYCYVDEGVPIILEAKPENFEELPNNFIACCPSPEIAEKAFRCSIKIDGWRSQ